MKENHLLMFAVFAFFMLSCGQKHPKPTPVPYKAINSDVVLPVSPSNTPEYKGKKRLVVLRFDNSLPESIDFTNESNPKFFFTKDCIKVYPQMAFELRNNTYDKASYSIRFLRHLPLNYAINVQVIKAKTMIADGKIEDIPIIPVSMNFATKQLKINNVKVSFNKNRTTINLKLNYKPLYVGKIRLIGPDNKEIQVISTGVRDDSLTITTKKLPEGAYKLVILKGFIVNARWKDQNLSVATGMTMNFQIKKDLTISVENIEQGRRIKIHLSAKDYYGTPLGLNAEDLKKSISFTPQVRFSLKWDDDAGNYVITGGFRHGEQYRMVVKPPLIAKNGFKLHKQLSFLVNIKRKTDIPNIRIPLPGVFSGLTGNSRIRLNVSNVKHLYMTAYRIPLNNLPLFLKHGYEDIEYGYGEDEFFDPMYADKRIMNHYGQKYMVDKPIDMGSKKGRHGHLMIRPRDYFRDKGLYFLIFTNYKSSDSDEAAKKALNADYPKLIKLGISSESLETEAVTFVGVTDIAIVAKVFDHEVDVWTYSQRTLRPIGGVKIRVFSRKGVKKGVCRTNKQGFCAAELKNDLDEPPGLVFAEKGRDFAFADLKTMALKTPARYSLGLEQGDNFKPLIGYIALQQGVFRPGEVAKFAVIVRKARSYEAVSIPVIFKVFGPSERLVSAMKGTTDQSGLITFDFRLPQDADTGRYSAQLWIGGNVAYKKAFFVEPFTPERMHITLAESQARFGAPVKLDVNARYLFGAEAAGASYDVMAFVKDYAFNPPEEYAQYRFQTPVKPHAEPYSERIELNNVLDKNGKAEIVLKGVKWDQVRDVAGINVYVDVKEAMGGRKTRAFQRIQVYKYPYYIGLKPGADQKGRYVVVSGVVLNLDGTLHKKAEDLRWEAIGVKTRWVPHFTSYGVAWQSVRYHKIIKKNQKVKCNKGEFTIRFRKSGSTWYDYYILRVKDRNTGQLHQVKAYDYLYFAGNLHDLTPVPPQKLRIITDKKSYDWGQTVKLDTKTPFEGHVLWIVETDHLIAQQWQATTNGHSTFSFKVPENTATIYVSALLAKREKNSLIDRAFGIHRIMVRPAKLRLNLKMDTPVVTEPLKPLHIHLHADKPFHAVVTVVDEGILQLTSFKTPDLYDGLLRPYALASQTMETFGLFRATTLLTGGGNGSNPEASQASKTNFDHLVAIMSDVLKSDASGNLDYTFNVPLYYGKLRVMVHAADDTGFVSTDTDTVVRSDMVIQPTIPRFTYFGDKFSVPVFYSNTTDRPIRFTANITAQNATVEYGKIQKDVAAKQSGVFFVRLTARDFVDYVKIRIDVSYPNGKYQDTFRIPVIPNRPKFDIYKTFKAKPGMYAIKDHLKGLLKWHEHAQISVGPVPIGKALTWLDQVVNYPWGCLEQLSSKLLTLVRLKEMVSLMDVKAERLNKLFDMVNQGVTRVLNLQTSRECFKYWPSDYDADPWNSAYATMVLYTAKQNGYFVPKVALKAAFDCVQNNDDSPFNMFVLGFTGNLNPDRLYRYIKGYAERYAGNKTALLFLAGAAHFIGDRHLAQRLWARAVKIALRKNRRLVYGNIGNDFDSPVRQRALQAYITALLKPDQAGNVVSDFLMNVDGPLTTQETAWAVMMLSEYLKNFKTSPEKLAIFRLNSRPVTPRISGPGLTFVTNQPDELTVEVPDTNAPAPFITIQAQGYKESGFFKPEKSGVEVTKRILDLKGNPLRIFRTGTRVITEITVRSLLSHTDANMVINDGLPMGFELPNMVQRRIIAQIPWIKHALICRHIQRGNTKIACFFTLRPHKTVKFYYVADVVTAEKGFVPPARVTSMYDPRVQGMSDAGIIRIHTFSKK